MSPSVNNPVCCTADCGLAECEEISHCPDPIPESLCRTHLGKTVGSVTFGRAEQLRRLLEWLGERSLAAHPAAPTEKEIAAAVLNRKDFDPQADSLVRKEMSRLREKLSRYYLSEGLQDEVRISIAGYLLRFELQGNVNPGGERSCWLVLPFRSGPEMAEHAERLLEELLIALDERGGPVLVAPTTALGYRGRSGDIRHFAAECRANFVVEGSLRRRNESFELTAWLVDGQSGRVRRSKRIAGSDALDLAHLATSWLLEEDPAE
jgi:TolB-like protein